jgi:hypothetical protein
MRQAERLCLCPEGEVGPDLAGRRRSPHEGHARRANDIRSQVAAAAVDEDLSEVVLALYVIAGGGHPVKPGILEPGRYRCG